MFSSKLGLSAALAVILAGCGGSSPATAVLHAEGSGGSALVRFTIDGEETILEVQTPWREEVELDGSFAIEMAVENPEATGEVTCGISALFPFPVAATGEVSAACRAVGSGDASNVSGETSAEGVDREVVFPSAEDYTEAGLALVDRSGTGIVVLGLPSGWRVTDSAPRKTGHDVWIDLNPDTVLEVLSPDRQTVVRVFLEKDTIDVPPLEAWTDAWLDQLVGSGFSLTEPTAISLFQGDGLTFSGSNQQDDLDAVTFGSGEDRIGVVAFHPAGTPADAERRLAAQAVMRLIAFDLSPESD